MPAAMRGTADGSRNDAAAGWPAVPGDQARHDGHVHLPGLRGDVLRKPVRFLLLSVRLTHRVAATATVRDTGVLCQLVADPVHQHDRPRPRIRSRTAV